MIGTLKKKYNELLSREKKAELYFDNPSVEQSKKDNWLPEYMNLTRELSKLMSEYKIITGIDMKDDEVLNGFQ